MKILALVQKDVKVDITDNYSAALKYLVDHGAPFNLEYKTVSTKIQDLGTYLIDVKGYDIVLLNYDPIKENNHTAYTFPYNKDLIGGVIPCGKAEDEDTTNYLTHCIAHEIMHAMDWRLQSRFNIKTGVNAVMDTYYINTFADNQQSNFNQSWKLLKPYMKLLFPLYSPVGAVESSSLSQWKLVPELEEKAAQFLIEAKKAGYNLKITQGFREPAYQDKLYAQGRTLPGKIVTNATGKTSKHCLGKAFDFAYTGKDPYPANGNWKAIGEIGEKIGLTWGGRWKSFKDLLHFEI